MTIASLVGLAIAVGLAIFALTQRSEAREQEALARASLSQAEASAEEARASAAEASQAQSAAEDQARAAQEQARISHARQLAAVATTQLTVDPELGTLLAVEAARLEPLPEIADVLRQTLLTSRVRLILQAEGPINAASYSADGSLIVTASGDGVARLYDAASGDPVDSLDHGQPVNAAVFSPDGKLVATGSDDGTARLWAPGSSSTEAELILEHEGPVTSLAFGAGGTLLATASRDRMARIWNVSTGEALVTIPHPAPVTLVAFDPVNGWLATADEDDVVRVFDSSGEWINELQHRARVTSLSWRGDSSSDATASLLGTTSDDKTARLWAPGIGPGPGRPLTGPRTLSSPVSSARAGGCSLQGAPMGPPGPGLFRAAIGAISFPPTETTSRTSRSARTAHGS